MQHADFAAAVLRFQRASDADVFFGEGPAGDAAPDPRLRTVSPLSAAASSLSSLTTTPRAAAATGEDAETIATLTSTFAVKRSLGSGAVVAAHFWGGTLRTALASAAAAEAEARSAAAQAHHAAARERAGLERARRVLRRHSTSYRISRATRDPAELADYERRAAKLRRLQSLRLTKRLLAQQRVHATGGEGGGRRGREFATQSRRETGGGSGPGVRGASVRTELGAGSGAAWGEALGEGGPFRAALFNRDRGVRMKALESLMTQSSETLGASPFTGVGSPCMLTNTPVEPSVSVPSHFPSSIINAPAGLPSCVVSPSSCPTGAAIEANVLWSVTRVPFADVPTSPLFLSEGMTRVNYDIEKGLADVHPFSLGELILRNFSPFEQFLSSRTLRRVYTIHTFRWSVGIQTLVGIPLSLC